MHYVAFGMPKSTVVAAVRARDGHVLRSSVLEGFFGVPLVTYDGTSAASPATAAARPLLLRPPPGAAGKTSSSSLEHEDAEAAPAPHPPAARGRSTRSRPNGSTSTSSSTSRAPNPRYRVRTFDVARGGKLARRARRPPREASRRWAASRSARASSVTGRWAYTLYARRKDVPFVHALDTVEAAGVLHRLAGATRL